MFVAQAVTVDAGEMEIRIPASDEGNHRGYRDGNLISLGNYIAPVAVGGAGGDLGHAGDHASGRARLLYCGWLPRNASSSRRVDAVEPRSGFTAKLTTRARNHFLQVPRSLDRLACISRLVGRHRPHRRFHKERHHERLAPSPAIGSPGAFGFWLKALD
jgi:hypothetical protein